MSDGHHKQLGLRLKAVTAPDEGTLAAIRMFTLADIPADQLVVREYILAHNAIDRDDEVFDEGLLRDFANTLPGKGVFITHPGGWSGSGAPGEGRVFAARAESMSIDAARTALKQPDLAWPPDRSDALLVYASAYFVRTPDNASLLVKQDAGIVSDVSIGFSAASRQPVRDSEGRELQARRWVGPGEALEMSLVWLGAQPGARAVKQAKTTEEPNMDLQKKLDDATGEIKTLTEKLAAQPKEVAIVTACRTALGDNAALLDDAKALAAAVVDGKAYRASVLDDLVAADREAGLVKDDEASVKTARENYDAMPTGALKQLHARFAAIKQGGAGIKPSDPNPSKPSGDKAATGVLANPLIG